MTATTATSGEMIAMLRRHYLPDESRPGGIFAAEIQAPNSNRRADLIWQGVTAGAGYGLVGHEVKVTRTDVLVELADPTKCDAWMRYCNRWWLVVAHPSLVEGLDLPPTWGVLAPPSGRRKRTATIVHPAPALKPVEQAPALRTIATRLHWNLHRQADQLAYAKRDVDRLREQVYALERTAGPRPTRSQQAQQREAAIAAIINELGGMWTSGEVGTWDNRVQVADVVTALRGLGELRHTEEEIRRVIAGGRRELRRHVKALTPLLDGPAGVES